MEIYDEVHGENNVEIGCQIFAHSLESSEGQDNESGEVTINQDRYHWDGNVKDNG